MPWLSFTALARISPMRRPRVYVVAWGGVPDEMFRTAMAVGAESVAQLPRSEAWLTELLTDLGDLDAGVPSEGVLVGVVGGSGGAGATINAPITLPAPSMRCAMPSSSNQKVRICSARLSTLFPSPPSSAASLSQRSKQKEIAPNYE